MSADWDWLRSAAVVYLGTAAALGSWLWFHPKAFNRDTDPDRS